MNTLRETVTTPLDDRANPAHEGAIAPGAPEAPLPELDLDTVKEILGIPNEHLRNLRVTLFYHDLSRRLGRLIGFENANWCTFAVWASRQAGFVIRGEVARMSRVRDFVMENDGRPALSDESKGQQKLPEAWAESPSSEGESSDLWARWTRWRRATHWTHWKKGRVDPLALLVLVFASFSRATSEGNTKVFEDIATAFVPFLRLLEKSTSLEDPDLTEYLAKLNPLPSRDGGRLELKVGLLQYWRARHETDPGRRARHILHGNACVGYHEQTRLQQEISLAVNMPIEYLRDDLVMWYTYGPGARFVFTSGAGWMINTLVRRAAIPVAEWVAQEVWQALATKWIMQISLPGEELDLGEDLPPLPDGEAFPDALKTKALRNMDKALLAWLSFADRDTLRGSQAIAWTSLPERMNTICNLFRSRQQRPALHRPPFTPEQIAAIRRGEVPSGPLSGEAPHFTAELLAELRRYRLS